MGKITITITTEEVSLIRNLLNADKDLKPKAVKDIEPILQRIVNETPYKKRLIDILKERTLSI
jgi:hypothetical protein